MVTEQMRENGDFVGLSGSDDYASYFNHLNRVFSILLRWYNQLVEDGDEEEALTGDFLRRFLFTIQLFRMKYLFNPSHELQLDLNQSGFPHAIAIMELETDLRMRPEKLELFRPESVIKGQMLDVMLAEKREPEDLLWQLADRQYFSLLDGAKLVLGFTPGELILKASEPHRRKYVFSWACYDFQTSMLYIHVLAFDQDADDEPMEKKGLAYHQFLEVVRVAGSRATRVGLIASDIDNALMHIHPKMLKRVQVGPILCPAFSREEDMVPMIHFLREYGEKNDFALQVTSEILFSVRENTQPRKFLDFAGRTKRVRQVFLIPEQDLSCFEKQASRIYHHLILPHHVLQQVVRNPDFIAAYGAMRMVTYNKKGALHEIEPPPDCSSRP